MANRINLNATSYHGAGAQTPPQADNCEETLAEL